jgi:hypothetical protein
VNGSALDNNAGLPYTATQQRFSIQEKKAMAIIAYQLHDFASRFSLVDELKALYRATPLAIFIAGIEGRD